MSNQVSQLIKTLEMNSDLIRIILVDDHKLARESLGQLLGFDARFSIIKECDNGHDAIQEARQLCPDIMLVDINMDPINGFEVTKSVLETHPAIKIIGISVNNLAAYANKMIELGARGFITKGTTLDEMTNAILEIHSGGRYVSRDVKGEVLWRRE
jgi:two-component system, NarL family, invasion response regulator UvrY